MDSVIGRRHTIGVAQPLDGLNTKKTAVIKFYIHLKCPKVIIQEMPKR